MGGITLSIPTSSLARAASAPTIAACMSLLDDATASTIVVVPSYAQQRHAVSAWAAAHQAGRPPMVMPMATVIGHLADAVLGAEQPRVGADEAQLILERLTATGSGLGLMPGVHARLLQQFESEGVMADALPGRPEYDEVDSRPSRRLRKLYPVWKAFRSALDARGPDDVEVLRRVIMALATGSNPALFLRDASTPVRRLLLRDVVSLTVLERLLLRQLASHGWDIAIHWAAEPFWNDAAQGQSPQMGRYSVHDAYLLDRSLEQQQELVREGWSHLGVEASAAMPLGAERSFARIADEVRALLATVKIAVRMHGMPLSQIAIVVPDMPLYEGRIRDMARGMGIPLTGGERVGLLTTGPCNTLLTACDVVAGGWRRADLDRLRRAAIRGPLARAMHDVVQAGQAQRLVGGNGGLDWQMTLVERLHAIDRRNVDAGDDAAIEARRIVRDAVDSIGVCQEALPDVARDVTAQDAVGILQGMIHALGIEAEAAETQRYADDALRPCCDVDAVNVLVDTMRRYAHIMAENDTPLPFEQHVRALRSMLARATASYNDVRLDGVALLTPAAARGRRFLLVLSPGWVEGVFPSIPRFERVDHDVLPFMRQHEELDMAVDVLRCVNPEHGRLLVTWPRSMNNTETMPSQFIGLLRAGIRDADTDALLHVDATNLVLSADEQHLRIGPAVPVPASPNGIVLDQLTPRSAEALQQRLRSSISPTRLDRFNACPYAYAAERLYGLRNTSTDDEALTALERGSVMHAIVHALFRTLRKEQHGEIDETNLALALRHPVRLVRHSLPHLQAMLHKAARDVLDSIDTSHTYAMAEQRLLLGNGVYPGLLDRWLAMEYQQAKQGAPLPAAFEIAIAETITIEDVDVDVQLRVDRVDIDITSTPPRLVVIDYKSSSSSIPKVVEVTNGTKLQMPLYAHAVEQVCRRNGIEATVESAQYMPFGNKLFDAEAAERVARLSSVDLDLGAMKGVSKHSIHDVRASIDEKLVSVVTQLRQGAFPVRPAKGVCAYCSYNELCRVESLGVGSNHQ